MNDSNNTNKATLGWRDTTYQGRGYSDLMDLRVLDLRPMARDVCGSGTWISHARKDTLVEAILSAQVPVEAHAIVAPPSEAVGRYPSRSYGHEHVEQRLSALEQRVWTLEQEATPLGDGATEEPSAFLGGMIERFTEAPQEKAPREREDETAGV